MTKEKEHRISKTGIKRVRTKQCGKKCSVDECTKVAMRKTDKCKTCTKIGSALKNKLTNDNNMSVTFIPNDNSYLLYCPHCDFPVQVAADEVNCLIFRHGVIKSTGAQIPPHSSKKICDELSTKGLIWGCGKPFILVRGSHGEVDKVEKCGYI